MNKVNVPKFQSLLRKGTLNFSIDNIGLKFNENDFRVGMRSTNAIVILSGKNDVISGIKPTDSWDLNFSMPSKNVNPYFDLILPDENDEVNVKMSDGKITLTSEGQRSNIFFCSNHRVTSFDGEGPKTQGDEVFSIDITDDFIDKFNLVKKIAGSFGKIYFSLI